MLLALVGIFFCVLLKVVVVPETFVVEVSVVPPTVSEEALVGLARQFGTSPVKILGLLDGLPGIATKATSQEDAHVIALCFENAGFAASVKSSQELKSVTKLEPEEKSGASIKKDVVVSKAAPKVMVEAVAVKPASKATPPDVQLHLDGFSEATSLGANKTVKPLPQFQKQASEKISSLRQTQERPIAAFTQETGRKAKIGSGSHTAYVDTPEGKKQARLGRKLTRSVLLAVVLASLGGLLVAATSQWFALQEQARVEASLATLASASNLSRFVEDNGDISQLPLLPSPVPEQDRLESRFVISTNASAQFFSAWPESVTLTQDVQDAVIAQANSAIESRMGTQVELDMSDNANPFVPRLILSAEPLEHGSAIVGSVVTGYSYEPMLLQAVRSFGRTALFSLIPLLFAFLLGYLTVRRHTKGLFELISRADAVSKGHLDERIDVQTNDELKTLSVSLERLRVSTQASLDRLRNRNDTSF